MYRRESARSGGFPIIKKVDDEREESTDVRPRALVNRRLVNVT